MLVQHYNYGSLNTIMIPELAPLTRTKIHKVLGMTVRILQPNLAGNLTSNPKEKKNYTNNRSKVESSYKYLVYLESKTATNYKYVSKIWQTKEHKIKRGVKSYIK